MSDKQLKMFCSGISISDVISYIDAHPKEYEQFVKEEKKKEEQNEVHKIKQSKKTNDSIQS